MFFPPALFLDGRGKISLKRPSDGQNERDAGERLLRMLLQVADEVPVGSGHTATFRVHFFTLCEDFETGRSVRFQPDLILRRSYRNRVRQARTQDNVEKHDEFNDRSNDCQRVFPIAKTFFPFKKQDVAMRQDIWPEWFPARSPWRKIRFGHPPDRFRKARRPKHESPAMPLHGLFAADAWGGSPLCADLVDAYPWHRREGWLVPVHFHHDLSGHVSLFVVTQGIVRRHDSGNTLVLFEP